MPLDEVLALALRWLPGQGEVTLQRVAAGLVNDTYRATRDGCVYSLRRAVGQPAGLGLDRVWECRVLRRASASGVAPRIEHCDPDAGILVAEWAAGRSWTRTEARRPAHVEDLSRLLREVHALAIPQPARVMTPAAWITLYAGLSSPAPADLRAAAAARITWLAGEAAAPTVLCHGDLHRLNLVVDGRLRLLDWEYAHVAEPFWDLAGWVANEDWDADPARALVAAYLGRAPRAAEQTRFEHLIWLYDYVCLAWSTRYLTDRARDSNAAVAARAVLLAERLRRG